MDFNYSNYSINKSYILLGVLTIITVSIVLFKYINHHNTSHMQSANKSNANTNNTNNNKIEKMTNTPRLKLYYAPRCGHCKSFKPIWDSLPKVLADKNINVVLEDIDCTNENNTNKCEGVPGYPTIILETNNKKISMINEPRTADGVVSFIKSNNKIILSNYLQLNYIYLVTGNTFL